MIKLGGARGIYDDKDIKYYGNMKPMKGDVKNIDDYVYLYNTADKNGIMLKHTMIPD